LESNYKTIELQGDSAPETENRIQPENSYAEILKRCHAILLPYQQRWLNDKSPLKIWLAARQVGKSFSMAMEAITEGLRTKCNNLILSSSERQSKEVMQKVYMLLRYLSIRTDEDIKAERETREEVSLPNGSRIISLPANPDTVRGFSGNVFLDEFAFHHDARDIWRAMYPTVTRGFKVRVASTPNGKQNMFYDLWANDGKFSKHRVNIHEASEEGLQTDIGELRAGMNDPDSWAQEFECRFVDEATAYITYEMITACEEATASTDFNIETLSPGAELYLGVDVGRKRDLTVFWLLERVGDVLWSRLVREMQRAPFRVQRDFLYSLLEGTALNGGRIRRCCIDSSGIGAQLAEEAAESFSSRVEEVTFTSKVKEDLAVTLRRRFEDRLVRIPSDRDIREDIHSVKKLTTAAGNTRFDAERTEDSHADRFWALALALHAGSKLPKAPTAYESVHRRNFKSGTSNSRFARAGCW
jgi:phage FluMu gp28-like protein